MLTIRPSRIIIHSIGWLVFFSLPGIFILSQSNRGDGDVIRPLYWLGFAIYPLVFYLHTWVLLPRFYLHKKYNAYFLSVLVLLAAVFFLRPFDNLINREHGQPSSGMAANIPVQAWPLAKAVNPVPLLTIDKPGMLERHKGPVFDIISIALFFLVMALSIALGIERRWRIAVQQAARAEADKANAELSFLKSQINPHFLFNTLNNIYSLAVTKNENVADAVMKLSNIMRYVTDEVNENDVLLQNEIDAISDYISLQQLRLGKKGMVQFTVTGDIAGKTIAPLILMSFVENAFKHGISASEESKINISLAAGEKNIVFFIQNRLFETPRVTERVGIGIENTKKRLAFIYPGKHLLEIIQENGLFTVQLVLYI